MNVAVKASKHSAPGQYLGFALQPVRLCYHLLTCPEGAKVSLEYLDDVAIHLSNGTVWLEQTKSALKQNPLSDWAGDFWKAIANWLTAIESGVITAEGTNFRLYVTPPKTGAFAEALNDATSSAEITEIISLIKSKVVGAKQAPSCMPFLQAFLDAPGETQVAIVQHLTIESVDEDPVDPIRNLLATTVPPDLIDLFCQAAIGMAKQQADRLIQNGKVALLDGNAFKTGFRAFVQKNLMPGLLTSLSPAPPDGVIATLLLNRPTFIRQLEFIGATKPETLRAVSDYLRSTADKADWADRGLVFEGSLRDWDDDLVRRHGFIFGEISDLYSGQSPEVRGRLTYRRCATLQPPLEGREVPGHFVHGCFNALAESTRIGWHPDFETLLVGDKP